MNATDMQSEWTLWPKAWSPRPVKHHMSREEWGKVLRLSVTAGYAPNDVNGYSRREVRLLADALSKGLNTVSDPSFVECVEGLLEYLNTHAADGFTKSYHWKHLSRAG